MRLAILLAALAAILPSGAFAAQAPVEAPRAASGYADLLALNDELQAYMFPAFTSGVVLESGARVGDSIGEPAMAAKLAGLPAYERRLAASPVASWPRSQQVDWLAVTSMVNGYRFNLQVLKPWKRDPGFYLDPLMKVAFTEVPAKGEKLARLKAVARGRGKARGRGLCRRPGPQFCARSQAGGHQPGLVAVGSRASNPCPGLRSRPEAAERPEKQAIGCR